MKRMNTLPPSEEVLEHQRAIEAAASIAVHSLAAGSENGFDSASNPAPAPSPEGNAQPRLTDWRAIQGSHPTWIGFDRNTGQPK